MTNLRLSLLAAGSALALLAPAAASAHGVSHRGDRDRDRMPDRWELKYHLNIHRNDARRDADKDGLTNYAEYQDGTNPQKSDTDGDGVGDRNDVAGTVTSFDGTTLVISLPDGSTRSGAVANGTEVKCETASPSAPTARQASDGPGDSSGRGGDDEGDDDRPGTTTAPTSGGDDDQGDDDQGDDDNNEGCPAGALAKDAKVHEAELSITSAGAVWKEIHLLV